MKCAFTLPPTAAALAVIGTVIFHPGVAIVEPRFVDLQPTGFAQKATYKLDEQHATVYFEITHLELSTVMGRFNKMSGTIVEDPNDLTKSTVEFSADVASIDTGVAPRDAHLRTKDFFDVEKFPKLTFKSTKVERVGSRYVVTGDLTIKDKTKSISIPFDHFGPYKMEGFGEQPTRIGVKAAPVNLKRSDFGVGSTAKLPDGREGASDEVVVRISFEGLAQD